MRVLIFHGYLLRGTGSNIYNLSLCRALAALGHEVHLLCQERDAAVAGPARRACTVHNPDIGRVLPVYVADEYAGFDAVPVRRARRRGARALPRRQRGRGARGGRAVRARRGAGQPPGDGPGDPGPRRWAAGCPTRSRCTAARSSTPCAPPRALPALRARRACAARRRCWSARATPPRACGRSWTTPSCPRAPGSARPGWTCTSSARAARRGRRSAWRPWPTASEDGDAAGWGGEPGAAEALRALDPARDRIVSYVGKLIVSKGVDLLLAAWPLVVAEVPDARLCVVGLRHLPRRRCGAMVEALAARRPGRAARDRRAGPRARGRARRAS